MTNKILIDRAVLEQALDFCEFAWRDVPMNDYAFERLEATITALRSALEQPQVEQEPVAEITGMDEYGPMLGWHKHWAEFPVGTKLHTHPQHKRNPLTDDEINTIWRNSTHMTIVEVVRAIEAAHGIGGEK